MADHTVLCARITDILRHEQTLLIFAGDRKDLGMGDGLCLIGHPNSPRGMATVVTSISQHRLLDILDADLPRLGCDRETFLASWDKTNPKVPHVTNPEVTRVEFRPGFPEVALVGKPGLLDIVEEAALKDIQAAEDLDVLGKG